MAFRIVRNDITQMNTEAIVNTANEFPLVGSGCDTAIYRAAGYDELLLYRKEKIGEVPEGEVFITPGFNLKSKYIIHAVSPVYIDGGEGEEEKLRSCYRKSLKLARENGIRSIAFPLISTGSFGYPKEEGMRIAVDEMHAFLLNNEMDIYLVVFDEKAASLGSNLYPDLEEYIDDNYVEAKTELEYRDDIYMPGRHSSGRTGKYDSSNMFLGSTANLSESDQEDALESQRRKNLSEKKSKPSAFGSIFKKKSEKSEPEERDESPVLMAQTMTMQDMVLADFDEDFDEAETDDYDFGKHESKLEERMKHLSDTFSEYLMYLIQEKEMENAEVYKRAIVDKKIFSKIKNNVNYHPQKLTALCLCVGAKLNLDESKDLLARAGYALSPCDKTDIIFSYFIENEIYDMIELDIQLEEHGLPCIIS